MRRWLRFAPLVLLAGAASCAHVPSRPASLDALELRARRSRDAREARLAACESDLVVRVDGRATGRLPGVVVRAAVAAPDRARLRATWLLGTAFDVSARGDSVTGWLPSERAGFELPDSGDSLGIVAPARFVARALGATWKAPDEAWSRAVADSDGLSLAWLEEGDSVRMGVDREGRPSAVTYARGERRVRVRYTAWQGWGDDAWPARVEIEDGAGWVRVRIEIEAPRFAAAARPEWFALALPADARRLDLAGLRRALRKAAAGR